MKTVTIIKTWTIALFISSLVLPLTASDIEDCCSLETSVNFEALEIHDQEVLLKWTIDNQGSKRGSYVVERSFDGMFYELAGKTPLIKSGQQQNFVLMDLLSRSGKVYYRLAEMRSTGKVTILGTTSIDVGEQETKKEAKAGGIAYEVFDCEDDM